MAKKETSKVGATVGVAAGVAAIGAIAYLLFGPDGKKNQKVVKSWAVKMKGDIMEKIEKLEEVSKPTYEKIVHDVGEKYKKIKNASEEQLSEIEKEIEKFKKGWKHIESKTKPVKKTISRAKKSTTKKTV